MMDHQKSGSTPSFSKKLVHNERGQEVDQKSLFHGKLAELGQTIVCHNSGPALKM